MAQLQQARADDAGAEMERYGFVAELVVYARRLGYQVDEINGTAYWPQKSKPPRWSRLQDEEEEAEAE